MRKRMDVTLTKDFPIPDSDIIFEPGDTITIEYDDGSPEIEPAGETPDLPEAQDGASAVTVSEPEPAKDAEEAPAEGEGAEAENADIEVEETPAEEDDIEVEGNAGRVNVSFNRALHHRRMMRHGRPMHRIMHRLPRR